MSTYQILINPSAEKQIQKLPKNVRIRITESILNLGDEPRPHGSKKLQGVDAYRIRIGDYRVVYEIQDNILLVTVVIVGNRKDIYKK
jgi:mRNA interferase RelE/StbE